MELSYNDIFLPYGLTTKFRQEPVYEELGKTDFFCTKFDIQVQGILNINYISAIAPNYNIDPTTAPDNAGAIMKAIRARLLKPRKTLSCMINDVELIPAATGGPGTVDVMNGPQPQACDIQQLTEVTFLITYHIIAHYWENNRRDEGALDVDNNPGNPVLFNRWSETVDIDQSMVTTRTREGKYRIRSDNIEGRQADWVRSQMAVVGVPGGFIRESSQYKIDPSGLVIQYKVVDKETFKPPPRPAFKAKGKYTETCIRPGGAVRYGEVFLRLEGCNDPDISDQNALVRAAVAICGQKININSDPGPAGKGKALLQLCAVTVDMYENIVECRMRSLLQGNKMRMLGVNGLVSNKDAESAFTNTPHYDPQYIPKYLDRGTGGLLLQAAAYFDPSFATAKLGPGNLYDAGLAATETDEINTQMDNGLVPGEGGKFLEN